jgi:hypothetical protein
MQEISVYIPNLPQRTERRASIMEQFGGRNLFDINLVRPVSDKVASNSLWRTFCHIVQKEKEGGSDLFIFCEDDHVFTDEYSDAFLLDRIKEADGMEADMLSGGVSWMRNSLQVRERLFWVEQFNGMQFTVIYKRFYEKILATQYDETQKYISDIFLSTLSDSIFVMFPYISVQKEFGHSDVTEKNNKAGYVESLFEKTEKTLTILKKVRNHYGKPL